MPAVETTQFNERAIRGEDNPLGRFLVVGVDAQTGTQRLYDALEIDALKQSGAYKKGDLSFHCPCCGEGTQYKHVKTHSKKTKDGKDVINHAHWALKNNSWHTDTGCKSFDLITHAFRSNNLDVTDIDDVQVSFSAGRLPARQKFQKPTTDPQADFVGDASHYSPKPKARKGVPKLSVSRLEALVSVAGEGILDKMMDRKNKALSVRFLHA